ncbi:MAG: hypothetical protein WA030_02845 [Candidatus Microsaccharimonas sp.]
MWKRYNKALLVSLLVSIVIFGVSLLVDNVIELSWLSLQTVSSVSGVATAILLFGITWTLHQHFSASQQTMDKKGERVLQLVELLQNVQLEIRYDEKQGHGYTYGLRPVAEKLEKSVNDYTIKRKTKVVNKHYFDESVIELYQELSVLAENIFMPKSISKVILDELDMKSLFALDGIDRKEVQYYDLVVYAQKVPRSNFSHFEEIVEKRHSRKLSDKVVSSYNDAPVSIDALILSIRLINEAAMSWLKKNSPYSINDLNINEE